VRARFLCVSFPPTNAGGVCIPFSGTCGAQKSVHLVHGMNVNGRPSRYTHTGHFPADGTASGFRYPVPEGTNSGIVRTRAYARSGVWERVRERRR
jgi:hypothetical protein